jgi:uncharacterized protein (DUF305 family)
MKIMTAYGVLLALIATAFGLGCQTQPSSNSANTNTAATDHSGHDMSNMKGHDMSNMNGHDMSKMDHGSSAPGAAEQPFDLQFLDSMMHHHDGAIAMAEMALLKSEREELKTFARKIIEDQKRENAQMKTWRESWYSGKPSALNMELEGMKMGNMSSEHSKEMDAMQGKAFDTHFLDMMVPHHEGAVKMARELLKRGEHAELKALAEQIIKEQEAEINQMQAWKAEWSK